MGKRTPPKAQPTHWTLKPADGKNYKGTHFRRLEDIKRGLKIIDKSRMPSGGQFLFLYYGCEKLGKGIVGIHELKLAVHGMGLAILDAELDALFLSDDKTTARYWRNEIVHNFGPSNVENVVKHSATLNRLMHDFLASRTPPVLAYLKRTYAHLLP